MVVDKALSLLVFCKRWDDLCTRKRFILLGRIMLPLWWKLNTPTRVRLHLGSWRVTLSFAVSPLPSLPCPWLNHSELDLCKPHLLSSLDGFLVYLTSGRNQTVKQEGRKEGHSSSVSAPGVASERLGCLCPAAAFSTSSRSRSGGQLPVTIRGHGPRGYQLGNRSCRSRNGSCPPPQRLLNLQWVWR